MSRKGLNEMDKLIEGSVWYSMVHQGLIGDEEALKHIPQIEALSEKGELDIYVVACAISYLSWQGFSFVEAIAVMDELIDWFEDVQFIWEKSFYRDYFYLRCVVVAKVEEGLIPESLVIPMVRFVSQGFEDFAMQFGEEKDGFGLVKADESIPSNSR